MGSGEGFTMRNFIVCTVFPIRLGTSCSQNGKGRSAFKVVTGKHAENRRLGRHRRRWEDKIRMNVKEIGINRGIGLIQLRIGTSKMLIFCPA